MTGNRVWLVAGLFAIALLLVVVQIQLSGSAEPARDRIERADSSRFAFLARDLMIDLRQPPSATAESASQAWQGFSLGSGWARLESWGVWAVGERSVLRVLLTGGDQKSLFLECMPYKGVMARFGEQKVTVRVNGSDCGTVSLRRGFSTYRLPIAAGVVNDGLNTVELEHAHHLAPVAIGQNDDHRELAIGVRRVALIEDGDVAASDLDWRPAASTGDDGVRIIVRRPGKLLVPLPSAAMGGSVTLGYSFDRRAVDAVCTAIAGAVTESAEGFRATDTAELSAAETRVGRVDLEVGADGMPMLAVDVQGVAPDARFIVNGVDCRGPEATGETAGEGAAGTPVRAASAAAAAGLPDVIVIILDASRADHFGTAYGYQRDTTPNIDQLARQALVFDNAFAVAPYTFCSVPTMITGMSFRRHGVVTKDLGLADDAVTLAEYLKAAGYQTLGFSATVNNSIRLGFAQGYDEFHEMWQDGRTRAALSPHRLSRVVVDRIEKGLQDGPVHMLLHYVPPHAPYTPLDRFDKFTDSTYAGPCDGNDQTLTAIERGELAVGESDVDEIVGLYDGNLLMADDAVVRVFAALKRAGRWQNAVVIVTSDHGEAFLEHGKLQHNTTVYDEMMHVPLIVKLPRGHAWRHVDTENLASLEDLVPTLLGIVGITPSDEVTGIDLLAPDAPARHGRDPLVFRNAMGEVFALRGERWKAVVSLAGSQQELYDLVRDADETVSRAFDEPLRMAAMSVRLNEELERIQPRFAVRLEEGVSADDEAMLRTLGYLD